MPVKYKAFFASWVLVNVLGGIVYLFFASKLWINLGEEDNQGNLGNAYYWISHSLPLLTFFVVFNFSAVIALRKINTNKIRNLAIIVFRILTAAWIIIVLFDRFRS